MSLSFSSVVSWQMLQSYPKKQNKLPKLLESFISMLSNHKKNINVGETYHT